MSDTMQNAGTRLRRSPPWSTDLVAVGAAVVCAMFTWFFVAQLADLELTVQRGDEVQRVGGGAVALAAGVSALLGFVCLRILERATSSALGIWTVLVTVVALLSLVGPLSATTVPATGALMSLHAVVTAVVIAAAQTSRRRRRATS